MKGLSKTITLFLISTFTLAVNAADVYKWLDSEGITHYTETAPADKEYELISTSGVSSAEAAKAKKKLANARAAKKEDATKKLDFEEQQKLSDDNAEVRKENCKTAKANLKTMQEHARIRIKGEDGELRYLSEEEKQEQLNNAKQIIKDNCDA